jgi:hypothetical protein
MSDELNRLLKESFEYNMTNVHTSFPGSVVSYDSKTRRADIQPYLKRKMPDGQFLDFPIITDVPIRFFGTKCYTIHLPLEKNDEVMVFVCERSLDKWRDTGGTGIEDADPRRFNIMDSYAIPGLQPVEFIPVEEPGLNIVHKTNFDGEFISSVTMDDDKINLKYKKKADVLIEDNRILVKTEKNTFELNDAITLTTSAGGLIEIGNTVDTLGGIIDTLLGALENLATEGSPAAHTAKTWATANITPLKAKAAQVLKK